MSAYGMTQAEIEGAARSKAEGEELRRLHRQYAAAALSGLIANIGQVLPEDRKIIAAQAFAWADVMMEAQQGQVP